MEEWIITAVCWDFLTFYDTSQTMYKVFRKVQYSTEENNDVIGSFSVSCNFASTGVAWWYKLAERSENESVLACYIFHYMNKYVHSASWFI